MAAPAGTGSVATGALMWLPLIERGAEPSRRVGKESAEESYELLTIDDPAAAVELAVSLGEAE